MTLEEARDEILKIESPNILCELPTSFGKTRIALDIMRKRFPISNIQEPIKILIVVPRLVLIDNWKDEFKKWKAEDYLIYVEFVTYASFHKKVGVWDLVIFDEVHHLSARCRELVGNYFFTKNCIMLSATVSRDMKLELNNLFLDLYIYKVTARKAIEEKILPDPKVYLIPLNLDKNDARYQIIKNKSQKIELRVSYNQRFNYTKVKNRKIVIKCTQKQYYDDMSSMIAWYKKKAGSRMKTLFLRKSGERLKWLSNEKSAFVHMLLSFLSKQRTLTFCNGIDQTEQLGTYCINSKNTKQSIKNLIDFNNGTINHITACNMLDEGVNLVNCRVGVYAVLNSSERMITQKLGRLLRHPKPIIIIPYYKDTREEEIVKTMLENYNPELVEEIDKLIDLKL